MADSDKSPSDDKELSSAKSLASTDPSEVDEVADEQVGLQAEGGVAEVKSSRSKTSTDTTSGIVGDKSSSSSNKSPVDATGKSPGRSIKNKLGSALKKMTLRSPRKPHPDGSPKSKGIWQRAVETMESAKRMFVTSKVTTSSGGLLSPGEERCLAESDELERSPSSEGPSDKPTSKEIADASPKKQSGFQKAVGKIFPKKDDFFSTKFDETNDPLVEILKEMKLEDSSECSGTEMSSQANSETELIRSKGGARPKDHKMSDRSKTSTSTDEGVLAGLPSSASSDPYDTDSSYLGGSTVNVFDDAASENRKLRLQSERSDAEKSHLPSLTEQDEVPENAIRSEDKTAPGTSESSSGVRRRSSGTADPSQPSKSSPDRRSWLVRQRRVSEAKDSDTEDEILEAKASSSPQKRLKQKKPERTSPKSPKRKSASPEKRAKLGKQKKFKDDSSPSEE